MLLLGAKLRQTAINTSATNLRSSLNLSDLENMTVYLVRVCASGRPARER